MSFTQVTKMYNKKEIEIGSSFSWKILKKNGRKFVTCVINQNETKQLNV
jgi:hypothetical protein